MQVHQGGIYRRNMLRDVSFLCSGLTTGNSGAQSYRGFGLDHASQLPKDENLRAFWEKEPRKELNRGTLPYGPLKRSGFFIEAVPKQPLM